MKPINFVAYSLIILILYPYYVNAEIKIFTKEYTYEASELDSKVTSRFNALEQVKRMLLEEIGVFLSSHTKVVNAELVDDEITSITAGVVSAVVVDEKWDGRKYWLKAKIEADPDVVKRSIDIIRLDKRKTEDLEKAKDRIKQLSHELEAVKQRITDDPNERQKLYTSIVNKISAQDSLRENLNVLSSAYSLSVSDKKHYVELLSNILKVDSELADAYWYRASLYYYLHDYKSAVSDLVKLLTLDYKYKHFVFDKLANSYMALNDYGKAIECKYNSLLLSDKAGINFDSFSKISKLEYNLFVKRYPKDYRVYVLRARSRLLTMGGDIRKNRDVIKLVMNDANKSIKLNKNQILPYFIICDAYLYIDRNHMDDSEYINWAKKLTYYATQGLKYNKNTKLYSDLLFIRANYGSIVQNSQQTINDYIELLNLNPNSTSYLEKLGDLKAEAGEYYSAINYYEQLVKLNKKLSDLHYSNFVKLAEIYKFLGNDKKSNENYNLALSAINTGIDKYNDLIKRNDTTFNYSESLNIYLEDKAKILDDMRKYGYL